MLDQIFRQTEAHPERPAVVVGGKSTSYRELGRRVNALRAEIDRLQSAPGRVVAVVDHGDVDTYAAVLAALCAGHAYVPLNPRHPVARTASVLEQSEATLVLDSRPDWHGAETLKSLSLAVLDVRGLRDADDYLLRPASTRPEQLAYLIFTSGSTGTPKGVPISRANLQAFLEGFFALVPLGPEDRVLQMFDLTFDFSVMSVLATLAVGAALYPAAAGEHRFKSVYRLLDESRLTCAPMVPSVLAFLKPFFGEIRLPELRASVFCGEPLLEELTLGWSQCAPQTRVFNFYGPTEATVFCSCYEWHEHGAKSVSGALSIGRPMKHAGMFVLREDGVIAGAGERGELCITGAQLTEGYWLDAAKTTASFFDVVIDGRRMRAYRTGDSAFIDDQGDFMYLGRLDNQVKVQGFRIELAEVEHHARACGHMTDLAAVAIPGASGLTEIVLCASGLRTDTREILAAMGQRVPQYMVPSRVVSMDSLPLNNNGKVDRPALRQLVIALTK